MSELRGWPTMGWGFWGDLGKVRERLAAGADPDAPGVLHLAAEWGSAEVVAELARVCGDVDAVHDGRTALWVAVQAGRIPAARALAAAGADPWRPMMSGWSPGRLALAGGLVEFPPAGPGLTEAEAGAVAEARRLIGMLDDLEYDGMSLVCVRGVDAATAVRRLEAEVLTDFEEPDIGEDDEMRILGVTDVPGGCVVSQRFGYGASMAGVPSRLSAGTVAYGMYANPKSGNQGSVFADRAVLGWDQHPGGGWSAAGESADQILANHLFRGQAIAYCCFSAGLRLADARAFAGEPDMWIELPDINWWADEI